MDHDVGGLDELSGVRPSAIRVSSNDQSDLQEDGITVYDLDGSGPSLGAYADAEGASIDSLTCLSSGCR